MAKTNEVKSLQQKTIALGISYVQIFIGLTIFSVAYTAFLLPYQITSGGVGGISTLLFYTTQIPAQYSYLGINMVLLIAALRIMGFGYFSRTIVATVAISFIIGVLQEFLVQDDGTLIHILGEQKFMACVIGGILEGLGLAIVFLAGGSTGGTDIIGSCVNKYKNISLGRVMFFADVVIISFSYPVFHDLETLVVSYVTMIISMCFLDFVINSAHQSVQFLVISSQPDMIAKEVNEQLDRGATFLYGEGSYSKEKRRVLLVIARKHESRQIFELIHELDPKAFVSMSNVEGVFGEGFDKLKK